MKAVRIIDLSWPFIEGDFHNPAFDDGRLEVCMEHRTHGWHAETVIFPTHIGTHIDAPLHKIRGGKSLDEFSLVRFFGPAVTVNLRHKKEDEEILDTDLMHYDSLILPGKNVLLSTGWSEKKYSDDYDGYLYHSPWLGAGAADYLVRKGVNAVGIDHFSIGGASADNVEVPHDILLGADILIMEDLALPDVLFEHQDWTIAAFPLKAAGVSGMPARIVAIETESS